MVGTETLVGVEATVLLPRGGLESDHGVAWLLGT